MPEFLSVLSYMNYKKNPKGTGLILIILSLILFIYMFFYFIADFDFILNGVNLKNPPVKKTNCERRPHLLDRESDEYCNFKVKFKIPNGEQYISKTTEKYNSFEKHQFMYINDDPAKIKADITSLYFLGILGGLSLFLLITGIILHFKTPEDKLIEERLKKTGKYYKTKFIRVETKKEKIIESYSKLAFNATSRLTVKTDSQLIKIKKHYIITHLRIKGKKDRVLEFKSKGLTNDPRDEIEIYLLNGEKIGVWVNPDNASEYLMDLSFLRKQS